MIIKTIELIGLTDEEKMKIIQKEIKFLQHIAIKELYYIPREHCLFLSCYKQKLFGLLVLSKDSQKTKQAEVERNLRLIYSFIKTPENYYHPICYTPLSYVESITVYSDVYMTSVRI